jgi:acyl carrier protein
MDSIENQRRRKSLTPTIFEQVQAIASDLFGLPAAQIAPQSSMESIEAWDSTQHLNFVLALEEKFNIQLSPEEMEQMQDIGNATKLVEKKLRNSQG